MKRTLALLTAAVMLFGMGGCTKTAPSTEKEPAGATLTVALSHSWKGTPLTDDPDFSNPGYTVCGDKIILRGWKEDYSPQIGLYDITSGELVKTTIPRAAHYTETEGYNYRDGRVTVIVSYADEEFTGYQREYQIYDESLNLIETRPFTIDMDETESILCWRMLSDGTQAFLTSNGFYLYDEQNGKRQVYDDPNGRIILSPDGTVWIVRDGGAPKRLDRETLTLAPLQMDDLPTQSHNNGGYYDGFGEYPLLCTDKDALYGLKPDTGEKELLVNFADSDLVEADGFAPLPDGRLLCSMYDYLAYHPEMLLLTPRTQEETDSIHTVTLSSFYFDQETQSRIARFNRQADGYRLVLKSYYDNSDPTQDYDKARQSYTDDLLAGNVPDIMLIGDDYQMLSNKGLFEDMRPWMEQDPDFHAEDYMMNVLKAGSYKGRLERIPWKFFVDTSMAKTEFVGDRTNLTPDVLRSLDLPEGMQYLYSGIGKQEVIRSLLYGTMGNFVDYANASCTFDGAEFIGLLELADTIPTGKLPEGDYCYQEDRVLLCPTSLWSLEAYHMEHEVVFDNADITLCGIGCDGGSLILTSGIAVSAQSKEKQAAWEFIKFNLQEDQQYFGSEVPASGFPINRKALKQMLADDTIPHDEHHRASRQMDGVEVEYGAATQEELAFFQNYLDSLHTSSLDDTKITAIVQEEAGKYFAGDCTAEDAAKAIQGRVSVYLAEQS
ncbi:MAG: hypothetical protein K5695_17685 [Oscillospiraceae bacterium]|nr:hypothetical protein [Oscillospiraceae bacterium]